jgi:hypothetical protein
VTAVQREHHVDAELPERGDRLVTGVTLDTSHQDTVGADAVELMP